MAATMTQILEGIEARLETVSGLRVTTFVPGAVNVPAAVIGVPPVPQYRAAMQRGVYIIEPTVTVLVSAALDRVGQMALASYADVTGPTSIPAAVEADKTLGGLVDSCLVVSFAPLGLKDVGAIGYFGGVFTLQVHANGTA